MYQKINSSIIFKLAIYAEVPGCKPWMCIQQRLNCSILKANNGKLCRWLVGEP